MINAQYIAMSKLSAMRQQMDVIANNIANMNTAAFKAESVLFKEFLIENDVGEKFSYVLDFGVTRKLADGPLEYTNNPLDVAIQGRGYFVVQTPAGERYTRNGHFVLDENGTLTTKQGGTILDDGGSPITIAPEDGPLTIASDGSMSTQFGGAGFARLQLVEFSNEINLKKIGDGLYTTNEAPTPSETSRLIQGAIEGSNVNTILQMTRMIDVLRSYQSAQKLSDDGNDLQRRAIERLGAINT